MNCCPPNQRNVYFKNRRTVAEIAANDPYKDIFPLGNNEDQICPRNLYDKCFDMETNDMQSIQQCRIDICQDAGYNKVYDLYQTCKATNNYPDCFHNNAMNMHNNILSKSHRIPDKQERYASNAQMTNKCGGISGNCNLMRHNPAGVATVAMGSSEIDSSLFPKEVNCIRDADHNTYYPVNYDNFYHNSYQNYANKKYCQRRINDTSVKDINIDTNWIVNQNKFNCNDRYYGHSLLKPNLPVGSFASDTDADIRATNSRASDVANMYLVKDPYFDSLFTPNVLVRNDKKYENF